MIAAVDAHYEQDRAGVAAVTFAEWTDTAPASEVTMVVPGVGEYVSGEFYRRELPCLTAVVARLEAVPTIVVVDGFVWLDERHGKGLGAHFYDAMEGRVAVVGVAKNPYRGAPCEAVRRGRSRRALYVSAAGMSVPDACAAIATMHGLHRTPTLLRRVDQLSRRALE